MAIASLVADVGATNARFALLSASGDMGAVHVFSCADYASIMDAISAYLMEEQASAIMRGQHPRMAALALAGLVAGDQVVFTDQCLVVLDPRIAALVGCRQVACGQ